MQHNLLKRMKNVTGPVWYADDATDVAHNKQLNVLVCWVNNHCEDAMGLC